MDAKTLRAPGHLVLRQSARLLTSRLLTARLLTIGLVAIGILLSRPGRLVHAFEPDSIPADQLAFFESKIRPVLVQHCYACHGPDPTSVKGGLRLDVQAGWQRGGDSGQPAIEPKNPANSLLIQALRHTGDVQPMPPDVPKLPDSVIADFVHWIEMGAPDPRTQRVSLPNDPASWQSIYEQRLDWWSLKPLTKVPLPQPKHVVDCNNEVDAFVVAQLESQGLRLNPQADRSGLVRRLSLVLTGLPPTVETLQDFVQDASPQAFERLVDKLLAEPHFGERWARHWMDVVHYSDTHGYEWDAPAKNAYLYRDYLTRAFNSDLSIQQFMVEQIAGDLIEPRLDHEAGVNETLIAPMALRLGERRHGDNIDAEGISQEAMANVVDTLGKGFLGTTVACSQCHDHKLDAIPQRDYYALTGIFMSTRWPSRNVQIRDPNQSTIERLRTLKSTIRKELILLWRTAVPGLVDKLKAITIDPKTPLPAFPETIAAWLQFSKSNPITQDQFLALQQHRKSENAANLRWVADFTSDQNEGPWRWEGFGMQQGQARNGDFIVSDEGDRALAMITPAGRWSNLWSPRMAGALRGPMMDSVQPTTFSIEWAGNHHPGYSFIVDTAIHSERMRFLLQPNIAWATHTSGNFTSLEGSIDRRPRRLFFEIATKSLNNYFPPRTAYGGLSENHVADPRSWFGVTKIAEHPPGKGPLDELDRFAPLFRIEGDWEMRLAYCIQQAIDAWCEDRCDAQSVKLLNEAIELNLLPNRLQDSAELAKGINEYRDWEKRIQPDLVVGSMDDWNEGRNERIGIRGSYTELGEEIPRGWLTLMRSEGIGEVGKTSGRLQLARVIANESNPLTARVFVNRVWHHLFGEGLVRTPDDFGHLGQLPTHPELLDHLAIRFMEDGWSLKQLVRTIVTSATWRQSNVVRIDAKKVDPENRWLHHYPVRRLEAEAIRDAILTVSEYLDRSIGGPSIDPYRTAQDAAKRLFSGPLDGLGRRSIYTKLTLMEPPKFMALFNQPIPKLTTGRRDVTTVPDQALALLNDPFVTAIAKHWGQAMVRRTDLDPKARIEWMLTAGLSRKPNPEEVDRLMALAQHSAAIRKVAVAESQLVWQDVAHAIFNLKEFIHVR